MGRSASTRAVRMSVLSGVVTLSLLAMQPGVAWSAPGHGARSPAAARPLRRAQKPAGTDATPKSTTTQSATKAASRRAAASRPVAPTKRSPATPMAVRAATAEAAASSPSSSCEGSQIVSSFTVVIDGVTLGRLRGNVRPGSLVTAVFVVAPGCSGQVTLKSFATPSGSFQRGNGAHEELFDSKTVVVGAGRFTLGPIRVPRCFFQVDLTVGPFPNRAGQNFRVDSAVGGSSACVSPPPPTPSPGPSTGPPTIHTVSAPTPTAVSGLALTGPRRVRVTLTLGLVLLFLGLSLIGVAGRPTYAVPWIRPNRKFRTP